MVNERKTLITRQEAAARAGVSPRTIDNWRKIGLLTTYSQRGVKERIRVDQAELDLLIAPRAVTS